jgi:branched-chain amino acid transport system substrate-binding protein
MLHPWTLPGMPSRSEVLQASGRRWRTARWLGAALLFPLLAWSQAPGGPSDGVVRIGVLTDMSGVFSDISGPGAVEAVRMAAEDLGGRVLGAPIEVLVADHQNKADIASNVARQWFDTQGVDLAADLMNSAVALSILDLAKIKNRVAIVNGASTSRVTNENCTEFSVHYTWDTYAIANGTARAVVQRGGDSWFFVTADFAYGHAFEKDTADIVTGLGGRIVGSVRHPINSTDFASFLLQAQGARPKIIALANGGSDTISAIKQARDFGVGRGDGSSLVGLAINLNDTRGLGLDVAQGLLLTEAFYWDKDDETRAWSRRFLARTGKMPTSTQAGNYSSTMHYLRAVQAAGTDEAQAVMAKMKEMPINDFFAKNGRIRADGRMVHDMYLAQVKAPSESKYDWDYYRILSTIPGEEAFLPLKDSKCPLVRR